MLSPLCLLGDSRVTWILVCFWGYPIPHGTCCHPGSDCPGIILTYLILGKDINGSHILLWKCKDIYPPTKRFLSAFYSYVSHVLVQYLSHDYRKLLKIFSGMLEVSCTTRVSVWGHALWFSPHFHSSMRGSLNLDTCRGTKPL